MVSHSDEDAGVSERLGRMLHFWMYHVDESGRAGYARWRDPESVYSSRLVGLSRILYRRHASNVMGIPLGSIRRLGFKIRRFWRMGFQPVMRQAEEFHRLYGAALPGGERLMLERFLESQKKWFLGRLGYALFCEVYRQSTFDDLILKALISLNRL
jgi:hypothetical protein